MEATQAWLDLHWAESTREKVDLPEFPVFEAEELEGQDTLLVRTDEGQTYLCSSDGIQRMAVKVSEEWPFDRIADDYRFFLRQVRWQVSVFSP